VPFSRRLVCPVLRDVRWRELRAVCPRAVLAALLLIQVVRVHAEMPSDARTAALMIPISLLLG
jgi:hypothetical protein